MSANGGNDGARVAASTTPPRAPLLTGLPPGRAQAGVVRPLLGRHQRKGTPMTSFIGLVRAVRRAGTKPPTNGARAARTARDIIGSARAIGAARRCTGRERETMRRAALVDLTRVARAALGIPADIALTRPGMSVPDDLDQLELVASPALEETR